MAPHSPAPWTVVKQTHGVAVSAAVIKPLAIIGEGNLTWATRDTRKGTQGDLCRGCREATACPVPPCRCTKAAHGRKGGSVAALSSHYHSKHAIPHAQPEPLRLKIDPGSKVTGLAVLTLHGVKPHGSQANRQMGCFFHPC